MPTGACGINCEVCKLNLLGTCPSCGPGTSFEAAQKLDSQSRLLGSTCAILDCARMNQIRYCLRDCNQFPCDNFRVGPYPYSKGFINMQERRLKQPPPAFAPDGSKATVAAEYWNELQKRDTHTLSNLTLFEPISKTQLIFQFLGEGLMVDLQNRTLMRPEKNNWKITDDPLLELVTVLYLINVSAMYPIGKDIVGVRDLKESHFFQGPHALKIGPLLKRYGKDLKGFKRAAEYLKGEPWNKADVAYQLRPFPRIPLYYLLWEGDEEFKPRMTVLFDRSIENVLAADAIWALINRVSIALLEGPKVSP
ncbi:MAG: DUF3786 domain-containing protein [Desulfobacterales bacterium]